MKSGIWKAADVLASLPSANSGEERYVVPCSAGGAELGLYAPVGVDPQTTHDRDEFYLVVSGHGVFFHAGKRTAFGPGDALFVAAGTEHRFEDFSEDFATWAVFTRPRKGG